MKQILSITTLLLTMFALSCKTNSLDGIYVCDLSDKKADSLIHYWDTAGLVREIEFKGNSNVTMKVKIGESAAEVVSSYIIENDYVRIKGRDADMYLKIIDQNTLVGHVDLKGTYHKK